MDNRILDMMKSEDSDSARILILSLIRMLRTGKAGVLNHRELRELLANRFEKALTVKRDGVSDELCITKKRNQGKKIYGDAKYDYMLWYWSYMDHGKEPTPDQIDEWLITNQPQKVSENISERSLYDWKKEARESYEPVMIGASAYTQSRL